MIRCIRLFSLASHRAHRALRIARHIRRAHRAYQAHIVSRVVCYAVAGGMALGGGAMLAHPPFVRGWEGVAPTVVPAPAPNLLPPSAYLPPGPIVWPAVIETPIQYPPRECVPGTRESAEAWCRHHHHHHPVPEPAGLAVLGVALAGLAIGRRA